MKNKILYMSGVLTSQMGTNLFLIAMVIWMKEKFDSSQYIGYFLFSSAIASLLCSPFSGVIVDLLKPKRVMVLTDLLSGLNMIIISLVMFGKWSSQWDVLIILTLTFVNSLLASLFAPASLSIVGQMVNGDAVKKILSLSSNLTEFSKILGRALAGVLIIVLHPAFLVLFNGISFLISAGLESAIKLEEQSVPLGKPQKVTFFSHLCEGVNYLKLHTVLLTLFIGAAGTNFFMAINGPLLPNLIKDILGLELWWYGIIMSASGVGALIGGFIAARLKGKQSGEWFIASLVLQGVPLTVVPLVRNPVLLFLLMFFVGLFFVFVQVHMLTLVNKLVPAEMRGRIFSLMFTVVGLFLPISYLISGLVGELSHQAVLNFYYLSGVGIPLVWVFAIVKLKMNNIKKLIIEVSGGKAR